MRYGLRTLLVVLALPFAFHTLLTGSPIPLWHIEKLVNAAVVERITADELVLEDGRHVRLPLIATLPQENSLFTAAMREGVEIRDDGQVFGLLWIDRSCGHDPYVWTKYRINLSELAGALNPDGIDRLGVHPDAIQFLSDCHRIDPRSGHMDRLRDYSMHHLRQIGRQFAFSADALTRVEPNPGYSIPLPTGQ